MFPTRRNCLFGSFLKGFNNIDSRNFKIYTIHDNLFFSQLAISPHHYNEKKNLAMKIPGLDDKSQH